MRILITGGTGFIGSRLARAYQDRGDEVTVLGRQEMTEAEQSNAGKMADSGIDVAVGSVTDRDRMFAVVKGVDLVIHLAAAQHEMNIPDITFREVNVEGTRNVLEAAVAAGVSRVVHGSTIGVYDRDYDGVIDEEKAIKPDNIYGQTKLEGEQVARDFFDQIPTTIVRISETYGPGDRRLLKLFRMVNSRSFFMIGKGSNLHQLIYIDDLVRGIQIAAENQNAPGQIFVLAGDERLTSDDMVGAVASAVGTSPRRAHLPLWPFMLAAFIFEGAMRPLGLQPPIHRRRMDFFTKSFRISAEKAKRVLGFVSETSFLTGAQLTADWYRKNSLL